MRSRSRLSGCCVVIVVDMDSLRHTQAWLLLFLTQTIDQNAVLQWKYMRPLTQTHNYFRSEVRKAGRLCS
ncbi:Phosphoribosyl-AMP cyclohydrolase [Dissostichus eleginoides]|uniref:Phosphoribosyl-AMP cyclohydrolase n=1 Tax=Dissostichus eleginoides TaxID=100907 RepID=A0AAD9FFJ6_DISEL|nr:Phosphoribosyl-AMP cyclohydrolase [Dissostichus eleginoides]